MLTWLPRPAAAAVGAAVLLTAAAALAQVCPPPNRAPTTPSPPSGRCVLPRQSQTDALPVNRGVSLFVRPRSTIDPMSDLGLDPGNWK